MRFMSDVNLDLKNHLSVKLLLFCLTCCGSFNRHGPHRFMKRFSLVRVGVALLEDMCHCGG